MTDQQNTKEAEATESATIIDGVKKPLTEVLTQHDGLALVGDIEEQSEFMKDVEATALGMYHPLQFFDYEHLPPHLQRVSEPFHALAWESTLNLCVSEVHRTEDGERTFSFQMDWNEEQEVGLRKLLEAKDCFVRAVVQARKEQIEKAK